MRTGSVCTGYGGLDMAVHEVLGGDLAWVADIDPGASAILAHRFPSVPNLGDISAADWSAVEPVDVLTAGFPCQDVSCAGGRAGLREGNRTGVWAYVARAIDELRPSLVVLENVRGLLSAGADSDLEQCPWCLGESGMEHALRASGAVFGDLADLGFDAEGIVVSAAEAGAPHRRERVFILAWPAADADDGQQDESASADRPADERVTARRPILRFGGRTAADAGSERRNGRPGVGGTGRPAAIGEQAGDHRGHGSGAPAADAERATGPRLADASQRAADGRAPADGHRPGDRQGVAPEDADRTAGSERRQPAPGQAPGRRARADAGRPGRTSPAADAERAELAREPQEGRRPVRRVAAARGGPGTPADAASDGRDARRPEPARIIGGPDAAERGNGPERCPDNANRWHTPDGYCTSLRPGEIPCPGCGCPDDFHDSGGFCAGPCGGNCTDPVLGRPDGGWNDFEDDADPADVRAYALAHSKGIRHGHAGAQGQRGIPAAAVPGAPADAASSGRQACGELTQRVGEGRGQGPAARTASPARIEWGAYEPAIRRWEAVLGRPAPRPTEPGRTGERLSPRFVEWLMGLPEGWVTDVPGLSRNAQLKALGNGVVPQQAAMALRLLLDRSGLLPLAAAGLTRAEGGEAA